MKSELVDLPAKPAATGLGESDVERRVQAVLDSGRDMKPAPTGVGRGTYLDLMERLVRAAAGWQDATGAMIDPVKKEETGQTSPRFVAAAAVLLHFGRCDDLREQVYRGMDYCCRRLSGGEAKSPDFWLRELMTAWMMISAAAPAERRDRWAEQIRSIDPEQINWFVEKPDRPIESLHNWVVYGAAGEGLRELAGLGHPDPAVKSGTRFWAKYMPPQMKHITADGMYRDPGDPFTYDMTTRLQFATPLAYGFKSPVDDPLQELLRRGALAELLYASPDGLSPFGGRSASFHLQECIFAAIGELEARRYRQSDPRLAGAFKRHAHLAVKAISRWLTMTPHRHLKNAFPPEKLHGCEGYGNYAVYSCFAASCLGLAALFADESIEETVTPAEIGGYVWEITPAFHKVLAVVGGTQVQIDTAADLHYDATGLGRFHRAGVPLELGPGMPFTSTPSYQVPEELKPKSPAAIGPAWKAGEQWVSLAELSEGLTSKVTVEEQSRRTVRFRIDYAHGDTRIRESYRLSEGRVRLLAAVTVGGKPVETVRMIVPLLESDGEARSQIPSTPGVTNVIYRNARLTVSYPTAGARLGDAMANRNGVYRPLLIETPGHEVWIEATIEDIGTRPM